MLHLQNQLHTLLFMFVLPGMVLAGWQDLDVLQVNTEKPHATMMTYPSTAAAVGNAQATDYAASPWYRSLNGDWQFHWSENPASRPMDFWKTDTDTSAWETIPVPSNWSKHGHGMPIYHNARYPFPYNPPNAPEKYNPVGSYVRTFTLPDDWKDRETLLHFEGVNSAFYLWVNGQEVGYSEGSRTPAEFNITPYLVDGENKLAVEVYRWCVGSYFEDQDFWRLAGIFRPVWLWSRDKQAKIRDYESFATLKNDYQDGQFDITAFCTDDASTVEFELLDADGSPAASGSAVPVNGEAKWSVEIPGVKPWSAERPNLYTLVMTLKKGGAVVESIPQLIGFRSVEIKDGIYLLNGVPVKMKGVNRHESQADLWQSESVENIMDDLRIYKNHNINAVRTSHYPQDWRFYQLANIYGIYVMDEANNESHGSSHKETAIAKQPEWIPMFLNRVQRMVYRDRNQPCIVFWSLGNECIHGDVVSAPAAIWIRENAPGRPIHAEFVRHDHAVTDVESRMYAKPGWLGRKSGKPSVLCEYSHAMGNSNGTLKEYWLDSIYKQVSHIGAYVWDWADQGLRQPVPDKFKHNIGKGPVKETFLAYGGWWNRKGYTDRNFCMNGVVAADRTPHPGLGALKHVYSYLHVLPVEPAKGTFTLKSWFDFVNVNEMLTGQWTLLDNGKPVAEGAIEDLDLPARAEKPLQLDLPEMSSEPGHEYVLTLAFHAQDSYSPLVESGTPLAQWQFELGRTPAVAETVAETMPTVTESDAEIRVEASGNGTFTFSRESGVLLSWVNRDGVEILSSGFRPDFWRALTDNDFGGFNNAKPLRKMSHFNWKKAGENWTVETNTVEMLSDRRAVLVTFAGKLPDVEASASVSYTISGDGEAVVKLSYAPTSPQAPRKFKAPMRMGLRAIMPPAFDQVEYYGRGPEETYPGRSFEPLGIFKTTVDGLWHDYPRPQENGARMDTRWVSFTDGNGVGVLFTGDPTVSFGAKFYDRPTIRGSQYAFQMERSDKIFVNIDLAQMGVGGITSWTDIPIAAYRLQNKPTTYAFRMAPVKRGSKGTGK